ncbi:MAG: hypothetical protein HY282_10240 [Nitrospirae bacterium]|nr:hypothetical protein [Candidatus Manganitrophaceae bacterium]
MYKLYRPKRSQWRIDFIRWPIVFILCFTLIGCASHPAKTKPHPSQPLPSDLSKMRIALEKYQDPIVAVRDGYLSMVGCIESPSGGVGVRFLNTSLMSSAANPDYPPILIYEPKGERLELVAAEWLIPVAMGIGEPPKLLGKPLDGPMEGLHPLMPKEMVHYDLRVWLFKENPAGLYSPTNPEVTCPRKLAYRFQEKPPRRVNKRPS